jgi:hypothetical protein
MRELSKAAQAVLNAVCENTEPDCDTQHLIAVALREAVEVCKYVDDYGDVFLIADEVLAIADELEAT